MDAADDELIAKLLLQDQMQDAFDNPYGFGGIDDEDFEDDFVPASVRLKARAGSRASSKRKAAASHDDANDDDDDESADPSGGGKPMRNKKKKNKKKKDKAAPGDTPFAAGKWTADEEQLFVEALELHGRDWDKCAALIKTRGKDNIKSHAQKHFIKLFKEGRPLPAKVQESGAGHTLSGKPLDPESAAARQYMGLPKLPSKKQLQEQQKQQQASHHASDDADAAAASSSSMAAAASTDASKKSSSSSAAPAARAGKVAKRQRPFRESDLQLPPSEAASAAGAAAAVADGGRSAYARSRLREAPTPAASALATGASRHPLTMVKCQRYTGGPAGSEVPGAAPLRVTVSWQALALADLHAHLARTEIIGLLAGSYRPDARELTVTAAMPCRTLGTECDAVNVEMLPESELEVREQIRRRGLSVVGWYHSHPVFQPDPSLRDVENQANYQALFRDEAVGLDPFIGIIIGPYDVRLPSEESCINYFHVRPVAKTGGGGAGCSTGDGFQPMAIEPTLLPPPPVSGASGGSSNTADTVEFAELEAAASVLIDEYCRAASRTGFDDVWRYAAPVQIEPGRGDPTSLHKEIVVKPLTKLLKLQHAMQFRLGHSGEAAAVIERICDRIRSTWRGT